MFCDVSLTLSRPISPLLETRKPWQSCARHFLLTEYSCIQNLKVTGEKKTLNKVYITKERGDTIIMKSTEAQDREERRELSACA